MNRSTNPKRFLNTKESQRVTDAIAEAERHTSAEIKLVIVRHCWGHIAQKASRLFGGLKLDNTKQHNAVLILLVTSNRQFLVYGDRGINKHVGNDFWFDVRDLIIEHFRQDRIDVGLCAGIQLIGAKLASFFPPDAEDSNEIPDDVVFEQ